MYRENIYIISCISIEKNKYFYFLLLTSTEYLKEGEDGENAAWSVVRLYQRLMYLHNPRHPLKQQGQRVRKDDRSSLHKRRRRRRHER